MDSVPLGRSRSLRTRRTGPILSRRSRLIFFLGLIFVLRLIFSLNLIFLLCLVLLGLTCWFSAGRLNLVAVSGLLLSAACGRLLLCADIHGSGKDAQPNTNSELF